MTWQQQQQQQHALRIALKHRFLREADKLEAAPAHRKASVVAQMVKNLPAMRET